MNVSFSSAQVRGPLAVRVLDAPATFDCGLMLQGMFPVQCSSNAGTSGASFQLYYRPLRCRGRKLGVEARCWRYSSSGYTPLAQDSVEQSGAWRWGRAVLCTGNCGGEGVRLRTV